MKKEAWAVFYYGEKELCSYTLRGTFPGEAQATKEILADEKGIAVSDIQLKIELR